MIRPARLIRSAIVLKPSTLLGLHQALRNRKYQLLFSPKRRRKPGPKGPPENSLKSLSKQSSAIPLGAVRELPADYPGFRYSESATLRTHWVLVVMNQYTCRIIGFGVHAGVVDGIALCGMFNQAIRGHRAMPKYLRSDHDPLYRFGQWQANLRILEVAEIKTVPYVPLSSHPFVERLIGTFVEDNKSPVLWRFPLCGVRPDNTVAGTLSWA
jgi:putative transposase